MAMTEERAAERNTAERGKAVDAALATIEKQFGRGAIMRLGDRAAQNVEAISTGSVALDLALKGTDVEAVADLLKGQTCVAYSPDPIAAAAAGR